MWSINFMFDIPYGIFIYKKMKIEKILYQIHPLRYIMCGPSSSGKSVFLTKLSLNIVDEYNKKYINSPSLHQELYQKLITCFSKYIPINTNPNISIENIYIYIK